MMARAIASCLAVAVMAMCSLATVPEGAAGEEWERHEGVEVPAGEGYGKKVFAEDETLYAKVTLVEGGPVYVYVLDYSFIGRFPNRLYALGNLTEPGQVLLVEENVDWYEEYYLVFETLEENNRTVVDYSYTFSVEYWSKYGVNADALASSGSYSASASGTDGVCFSLCPLSIASVIAMTILATAWWRGKKKKKTGGDGGVDVRGPARGEGRDPGFPHRPGGGDGL